MENKTATVSINAPKGVTLKTNATHTYMKGIAQNANGGEIAHNAQKTLVQEDNTMSASNKGKIINEVEEGGVLRQSRNEMEADSKGQIINRIKSKPAILFGIVVLIGLAADIATILSTGQHFWSLIVGGSNGI